MKASTVLAALSRKVYFGSSVSVVLRYFGSRYFMDLARRQEVYQAQTVLKRTVLRESRKDLKPNNSNIFK